MSKKIAAASIICMVFGGVSIPGGMYVNNFIVDLTYSSMDDGLLGIKDEAIPLITPMVKEFGVAEALGKILDVGGPAVQDVIKEIGPAMVLSIIKEVGGPAVENIIKKLGPAIALPLIKENAMPIVEEIVKSTFSAYIMNVVFEGIQIQTVAGGYDTDVYGYPASLWQYFNDQNYQFNIDATVHGPLGINIGVDVLEFRGISQYFGTNLGFSTKARSLLAFGQELQQSGVDGQDGGSPFDDTTKVLGGPNVTRISLRTGSRVDAVGFTLSNGVSFSHGGGGGGSRILDLLPGEYIKKAQLKTGAKVDRIKFTTSKGRIFEHGGGGGDWRSEKVAPDGWQIIGFHGRSGAEVDKLGFIYAPLVTDPENWVPPAIGLTLDTASGSGVTKFLEMYENALSDPNTKTTLQQMYDCTWDQLDKVKTYVINYLQNEMIPIIIEGVDVHVYALSGIVDQWEHVDLLAQLMPQLEGSQSVEEIAERIFAELWSEGTALGNVIFEGGLDFGEILDGIPTGATGFEAGLDVNGNLRPLDFSTSEVYALWDENNEKAIANMKGIAVWYSAKDNEADRNALKSEFSLSDVQIDALLDWLWSPRRFSDYLLPILLETDIGYSMPIDELAMEILYDQWANLQVLGMDDLYPYGLDFSLIIDGIDEETLGFEAGLPTPLNLAVEDVKILWDETNALSLTNMDGILIWHSANTSIDDRATLLAAFPFLSEPQLIAILDWLWAPGRFADEMLPTLIKAPEPYGYGVTLEELAIQILYEQWANASVLGMDLYPEGIDFNDLLSGFEAPVIGLEVGIPQPTGLTLEQCEDLWNSENNMSLLDMMTGIPMWVDAKANSLAKEALIDEFGISPEQLDMILDWLWLPGGFSDYMVPILIESDYGYGLPMEEFCIQLLLEQWANGTVFGEVMFPDPGFPLPLKSGNYYGFEVGIPDPSGMSMDSALALWDKGSEFSLVNKVGKKRWIAAVEGDDKLIAELQIENGLDNDAMIAVLIWIPKFQQNVMPYLAEYQYDLPMDTITLAGLLQSATTIIGGSCIGLAILGLTGNVLVKKKRAKNLQIGDKISKHVFIKGMEEKKYDDPDITKAPEELLNANPPALKDNKEKSEPSDRNL